MIFIAWSAYIAIALVVGGNTYLEGEERQRPWGFARIVGLLVSLVWPALVLVVYVYVVIDRAKPMADKIPIIAKKQSITP